MRSWFVFALFFRWLCQRPGSGAPRGPLAHHAPDGRSRGAPAARGSWGRRGLSDCRQQGLCVGSGYRAQGIGGFVADHPDHRQRSAALALFARVQLVAGDAAGAKTTLERAGADGRTPDFDFLLGIAASRLGNAVLAVALLRPFLTSGPPLVGGLTDADAPLLLRAAAADALAESGDPVAAIEQWDQYRSIDGTGSMNAPMRGRQAEELAEKISGEAALGALSGPRAPFARALLGATPWPRCAPGETKPTPSGWSKTSGWFGATWVLTRPCGR